MMPSRKRIEATVDLVQPSYHPLAKFAKDIAAGAVLITTIIALVVGGLLSGLPLLNGASRAQNAAADTGS